VVAGECAYGRAPRKERRTSRGQETSFLRFAALVATRRKGHRDTDVVEDSTHLEVPAKALDVVAEGRQLDVASTLEGGQRRLRHAELVGELRLSACAHLAKLGEGFIAAVHGPPDEPRCRAAQR
jgi:hypothetical protein